MKTDTHTFNSESSDRYHKEQIIVVSNYYPVNNQPGGHTFVRALVGSLSKFVFVNVIAPFPVISKSENTISNLKTKTYLKSQQKIVCPAFLSFGSKQLFRKFNSARMTNTFFKFSVIRALKYISDRKILGVYGHFLYPSGHASNEIGRLLNIPSFLGYGEWGASYRKRFGFSKVKNDLNEFDAIIAVSNERKKHLINKYSINDKKIKTIHNAADSDLFFPKDKLEMRKKYGFSPNDFIIIFVGHFVENKGILTILKSLNELPDVKAIFLGKGPINANSSNTIFSGNVPHQLVPDYLSCADVFVLPTLMEGCSNAIKEAMACGLPIITSDRPFNREIMNDSFSIMIDPTDVKSLSTEIRKLQNSDKIIKKMSRNALLQAGKFTLEERSKKILEVIRNAN